MLRLVVDFDQMQSEILKMSELCDEYRQLYGSLINKINETSLYWKGKDQVAFLSKTQVVEDDFDRFYQLLEQYIKFLDKSLYAYRSCQDATEASSLRL